VAALARVEHLDAPVLQAGLDDAFARVAGRFARREVRLRARRCLEGLLSGLERKTGWSLAEYAGETTPDGMQRLFTSARWDPDAVRDDVRGYAVDHLGEADGVLIGDDTGFEKKGTCSAGVQRQYTGTAGKITNCQIGVFLAYASGRGRALVDRELYLPRSSWSDDPVRRGRAKVPSHVGFATKPQLLQAMIERAIAAKVPFGWVTADEAYGDNGPLRRFLDQRRINYVLAVSRAHQVTTGVSRLRADALVKTLPGSAWQRRSCGNGAKGHRWYDWALIATTSPAHHLLVRRSIARPQELAFFLCHSIGPVALPRLIKVTGARWMIEECFQAAKNEAAMDHYQVRRYDAWHRYITLSMLALAYLAVTRAHLTGTEPDSRPARDQQVPLSANEIRRLLASLCQPPADPHHIQHWSRWRRHHQTRARRCHYQRQHTQDH
jgi:SRSO17 transposase